MKFRVVDSWDTRRKFVGLTGGNNFYARVDFDDVDHHKVKKITEKMVRILNKHWDEEDE